MIAPDRDCTPRRRVNKKDRRRLTPRDRIEKVKLEAKEVVGSKRRREDYVEVGHATNYSRGEYHRRARNLEKPLRRLWQRLILRHDWYFSCRRAVLRPRQQPRRVENKRQ